MKILLDTNTYSHLKRGHRRVATLVRMSEEIFYRPFGSADDADDADERR